MKRIKKGDTVFVITGKDKGKSGIVKKIINSKVVVEGVGMIKKHVKPNPQLGVPGGIVEKESAIHISNVMYMDLPTNKKGRVRFKLDNGTKTRELI